MRRGGEQTAAVANAFFPILMVASACLFVVAIFDLWLALSGDRPTRSGRLASDLYCVFGAIVTALNVLLMRRSVGRGATENALFSVLYLRSGDVHSEQLLTCACGQARPGGPALCNACACGQAPPGGPALCNACAFDVKKAAKLLRLRLWMLVLACCFAAVAVIGRAGHPGPIKFQAIFLFVLLPWFTLFFFSRAVMFTRFAARVLTSFAADSSGVGRREA